MYVSLMPTATVQTKLPFLDLGDETGSGSGIWVNDDEEFFLVTPSFLPFRYDWIRMIVSDLFKNLMIYYYCVLDFR